MDNLANFHPNKGGKRVNVSAGKINRKEKRGTFVFFFPSFLEGGGEF